MCTCYKVVKVTDFLQKCDTRYYNRIHKMHRSLAINVRDECNTGVHCSFVSDGKKITRM